MPSTVDDSSIFRDLFGTPAMRAVFSDEALARKYVEVEVAVRESAAQLVSFPLPRGRLCKSPSRRRHHSNRSRQIQDGDRYRRLSHCRHRASACRTCGRRWRPLRAWGATTRTSCTPRPSCSSVTPLSSSRPSRRPRHHPHRSRQTPPRHRHGRPHAPDMRCPSPSATRPPSGCR